MEQIVIANRAGAEVYSFSEADMKLVNEYDNPLGRLKNKEMTDHRPNMSFGSFKGSPPHRMNAEKDPQNEVAEQFARDLSKSLLSELKADDSLRLQIVAEPGFLGKLKGYMKDSSTEERVSWLDKDLKNVPKQKWPDILGLKTQKVSNH